jgi:recombination protein RecA
MMYSHGISREADLLDLAILDKVIDKSGSWFNYGDLRLGQGRENAKQYLRENSELADEIAAKVLQNRAASGGIAGSNGAVGDHSEE